MKRYLPLLCIFFPPLCSLCLCGESSSPHRSPIDIALLPGGRALTANYSADSVSLVDLEHGKVLAEERCGRKPSAVACSRDGTCAAVSNLWSGTVSLFQVEKTSLRARGEVAVGPLPRGIVFSPDGDTSYVAVADEVVQCDWKAKKVTRRL